MSKEPLTIKKNYKANERQTKRKKPLQWKLIKEMPFL
jgi:hypothetical protein